MRQLVWATNIHPSLYTPYVGIGLSEQDEYHAYVMDQFKRGKPRATDTSTVAQLESEGMIGLYKEEW